MAAAAAAVCSLLLLLLLQAALHCSAGSLKSSRAAHYWHC